MPPLDDPAPEPKSPSNEWKISLLSLVAPRQFVAGEETAVVFNRQPPVTCADYTEPYAKIVVSFDGATYEYIWQGKDGDAKSQRKRIVGRQICFVAPHVRHTCRWEQEAEVLVLYVRPAFLRRILGQRRWSGVVVGEFAVMAARDTLIWELTFLCRRVCVTNDPEDHRLIERLGHKLARHLLKSQFAGATNGAEPTLPDEELIAITDYIETTMPRPAGVPHVEEVARHFGHSPPHFTRLFKNTTGDTPKHYIRVCQMRKARSMLAAGRYRMKQIAEATGFGGDVSYFSRCYKEYFECPPSAHRHRPVAAKISQ